MRGNKINHNKYEFLPAALEVRDTPPHPMSRVIMWTVVSFFMIAMIWSYIGKVDVIAIAQGKIIPSGRVKIIQPLEIGKIKALHVTEGQQVIKGDVLVELDPTNTQADENRIQSEILEKKQDIARLKTLIENISHPQQTSPEALLKTLASFYPENTSVNITGQQRLLEQMTEYQNKQETLVSEQNKQRAEKRSQQTIITQLEQTLPIVRKRTASVEKLFKKNMVSESEYLQLKQESIEKKQELLLAKSRINEIDASIEISEKRKSSLQSETTAQYLAKLQASKQELNNLTQEASKTGMRNRSQSLVAPIDGVVQQLVIHTVGGVVTPAQNLMHIVPFKDALEVEAMLPNKDIGFVNTSQTAEVKVETFPFTKYGIINASLKHISNDAVQDERLGLVYPVRALLEKATMRVNKKDVNLTPGMAVTLEIKTGTRRIIEFILNPIIRGFKESIRER